MQAVLEQNNVWEKETHKINNKKVGLFASVFGCWHKHLSRPFSNQRASYRVCVDCGAQRSFDPKTLKTYGAFYFTNDAGIKSE